VQYIRDFFQGVKVRIKLALLAVMLISYSVDDKKYLAVVRTGWRGRKWSRHFEIVQEVDDQQRPINNG